MRQKFFVLGITALIISLIIFFYFKVGLFFSIILFILLLIGYANSIQQKHAILRNFPVLGYFRYFFEMISPEIQ